MPGSCGAACPPARMLGRREGKSPNDPLKFLGSGNLISLNEQLELNYYYRIAASTGWLDIPPSSSALQTR